MSAPLVNILHKYECNTFILLTHLRMQHLIHIYISATGFQSWNKYKCNTLKIFSILPPWGVAPIFDWLKTFCRCCTHRYLNSGRVKHFYISQHCLWPSTYMCSKVVGALHSYLSYLKKCCTHIKDPSISWSK